MSDLHEVIEDSVTDLELVAEVPETPAEPVEATPETPAAEPTSPAKSEAEAAPESTLEVKSPAAKVADTFKDPAEDDFAKKHGLAPQKPGERENRLPYSAVKRIVGNAEKKAVEPLQGKIKEFETKVTDYEGRLEKVAQFEQVMVNDPSKFLNMLAQIPAYRQIFEGLVPKGQVQTPAATTAPAVAPAQTDSDMPQPDQTLADGTKVYSLEGLAALNKWNREQARNEVMQEVTKRLAPIEQQRAEAEQARKYQAWQAQAMSQVEAQITEARKWALFNENEAEIVKALQNDPSRTLTLDGAYRQVVMPKLTSDYNSMRTKVIQELKRQPTSTSTSSSASKPATQSDAAPGDLEAIIRNATKAAGLL